CRKVRDCLAGNRNYANHLIYINVMSSEITFVESEHHRQIGSCRITGQNKLIPLPTIAFDVMICPMHSCSCIANYILYRYLRSKTITCGDYCYPLILQFYGDILVATCQSTSMKPYYRSKFFLILRNMYI